MASPKHLTDFFFFFFLKKKGSHIFDVRLLWMICAVYEFLDDYIYAQ
jgi:hypothetical protein